MAHLDTYRDRYSTVRMERTDGILQVTLHTGGGSLQWSLEAHTELPEAFHDIGGDTENRVVILTGTGEEFSGPQVKPSGHPLFPSRPPFELLDRVMREGRAIFANFLDIQVPVISAINGPAWRHSEVPLLADIVIASTTARFQDSAHFQGGLVPGDGMHVVYPLLLGPNRARYFLLTGQILDAEEAHRLGLVAEVVPPEQLLPRAWELARAIAAKPVSLVRTSRAVLVEDLKRRVQDLLGFGLYAETLVLMDRPDGEGS